jgi:hypothetical protein
VIKGRNLAIQSEDSGWQSASELENGEGRGRVILIMEKLDRRDR